VENKSFREWAPNAPNNVAIANPSIENDKNNRSVFIYCEQI
jgi:hypothetical protein